MRSKQLAIACYRKSHAPVAHCVGYVCLGFVPGIASLNCIVPWPRVSRITAVDVAAITKAVVVLTLKL